MISLQQRSLSVRGTCFRVGAPRPTGAVVLPLDENGWHPVESIPLCSVREEGAGIVLEFTLKRQDQLYGLGGSVGPINRKGGRYRLFAKDEPLHSPDSGGLYGSHPFLIVQGERPFALFIDYPGELFFDLGFSHVSQAKIWISSTDFDLFIWEEGSPIENIREFLSLTGAPYLPPRWSFGYQQCRYSYETEERVREVVQEFNTHHIPLDAIYLDIDYMENYKVFTVDESRFPDLGALAQDLKHQGIETIPIIDPGIKDEPGYEPRDSGLARGVFCLDEMLIPFRGAVWPGYTYFPDFLRSETRKWWGEQYEFLFSRGLRHAWNDMNEPAIFYAKEGLEKLKTLAAEISLEEGFGALPISQYSALTSFFKDESYLSFLHLSDQGEKIPHRQIHNLYGSLMARATAEAILERFPGERYFLLTRSSYAGTHRFAAVWTGDNHSWWEHLLLNIRTAVSFNLCGFLFCGADIGGHSGDCSAELLIRWTQLSVFFPLMRNHSAKGTRNQEPYAYDNETTSILRDVIALRYSLITFLYSEFLKSIASLTPLLRPLAFEFPSEEACSIDDQFMLGEGLMIAPIIQQNASGRYVHLPESAWLLWRAARWDIREAEVIPSGNHFISVSREEIPLFIRENSLITLQAPALRTKDLTSEELIILGFVTHEAELGMTFDDGHTYGYREKKLSTLLVRVTRKNESFTTAIETDVHPLVPLRITALRFEIYDGEGKCHRWVAHL